MKICPVCGEYEGSPWWTELCEYEAEKDTNTRAGRSPDTRHLPSEHQPERDTTIMADLTTKTATITRANFVNRTANGRATYDLTTDKGEVYRTTTGASSYFGWSGGESITGKTVVLTIDGRGKVCGITNVRDRADRIERGES